MTKPEKRLMFIVIVEVFLLGVVIIGYGIFHNEEQKNPRQLTASPEAVVAGDSSGNVGCMVATVSPEPEPCVAVQQTIRYTFFSNLVNSTQFIKWKAANPGEYGRVTAFMQANGPVPMMLTPLGGALINVIQVYWYARATAPLSWPAPNPLLDPKRIDKKPPSSPGNLKVELP